MNRKSKVTILVLVALFAYGLVYSIGAVTAYYYTIKPIQEKVTAVAKVTEFLQFIGNDVGVQEMQEIDVLLEKDRELYAKLTDDTKESPEEYQEIIQQRKDIYIQAMNKSMQAKEKLEAYPTTKETKELQQVLIDSFDQRIGAYKDYIAGYDLLLAGESGEEKFNSGHDKLDKAAELEEQVGVEFEEALQKILGENK